jgi:hypothetical protein
MDSAVKNPGRPQGELKGTSPEANELAVFLREVTRDQTVRQLAVRYMGGRTAWSLYRSGAQLIPLHLLEQVVRDRTRDQAGRELLMTRARTLHERAATAAPAPPPVREPDPGEPSRRPAPKRPRLWMSHAAAVLVAAIATFLVVSPEKSDPVPVQPSARVSEKLAVVTDSGEAVRLWDPATQRWTQIGGPADELYGGGAGLWAVSPGPGHIAEFRTAGNWTYIGERPAELAVGHDHVYRLAADRASVWRWLPDDHAWQLIGGPAGHLYAGGAGFFATNSDNTRLFRYDGEEHRWDFVIGGISADDRLVVGRDTVYRLTADRTAVTELDPANKRWQVIGGAARTIRAGGAGLYAVGADGGVLAYRGRPDDWLRIGDGAADIAVGADRVYRLGTDGALAEWSDGTWHDLRATAREITAVGR